MTRAKTSEKLLEAEKRTTTIVTTKVTPTPSRPATFGLGVQCQRTLDITTAQTIRY